MNHSCSSCAAFLCYFQLIVLLFLKESEQCRHTCWNDDSAHNSMTESSVMPMSNRRTSQDSVSRSNHRGNDSQHSCTSASVRYNLGLADGSSFGDCHLSSTLSAVLAHVVSHGEDDTDAPSVTALIASTLQPSGHASLSKLNDS